MTVAGIQRKQQEATQSTEESGGDSASLDMTASRTTAGSRRVQKTQRAPASTLRTTTLVLGTICIVLQMLFLAGVIGGGRSNDRITPKYAEKQPITLVSEADQRARSKSRHSTDNVADTESFFRAGKPYPREYDGAKIGTTARELKKIYPKGQLRPGAGSEGPTFSVNLNGQPFDRVVYFLSEDAEPVVSYLSFWVAKDLADKVRREAMLKLGWAEMDATPAGRRFIWKNVSGVRIEVDKDMFMILPVRK